MTSGVKSGLKSWLTFGSSVAGSQGGMARSKSIAVVSESEMDTDPIHSGIYEGFFWIFWHSVYLLTLFANFWQLLFQTYQIKNFEFCAICTISQSC